MVWTSDTVDPVTLRMMGFLGDDGGGSEARRTSAHSK